MFWTKQEYNKPTVLPINEALEKGLLELKLTGAHDPEYFYDVFTNLNQYLNKISGKTNDNDEYQATEVVEEAVEDSVAVEYYEYD